MPKPLDPLKKSRAERLIGQGYSTAEVARMAHIDPKTVRKLRTAAETSPPPPPPPPKEEDDG